MKYCDTEGCEAEASEKVRVSVNKPHDETRNYCYTCYEVYLTGVQHGRFHEAAIYKAKPHPGTSQLKPYTKAWTEMNKSWGPKTT